jgi:cysteine synthase
MRVLEQCAQGVLSAVGQTPIVSLRKVYPDLPFQLYAKLEALNPGGSIKDRPAREILQEAIRRGAVRRDTIVVESSSGNMGIGLAQACAYYGLRFICVVDIKSSRQNIELLQIYGAEIDCVVEPDPATGELLPARLQRVRELLAQHRNAFWPNQYANQENSGAHFRTTMRELATALDHRIDYVLCAASTCGTVRGCGEYVREQRGPRYLPGMGAGVRPPLCDLRFIDEHVLVSDLECVLACRRLVRSEGILAGASSGGLIAAVGKIRERIPSGATCAVILPDRGERYIDTVYSDTWVREHFGEVSDLWPEKEGIL